MPQIELRYKVLIVVVALGGSFAAGRWGTPTKVITEVKTVEVEKKKDTTVTDSKTDEHQKIVIVKNEKPDGEKITTTTITNDNNTSDKTSSVASNSSNTSTDNKHEEDHPEPKTTIAAMAGISTKDATAQYGVTVYRPIIGPIGIGLFGLGNVTSGINAGLEVGVTF